MTIRRAYEDEIVFLPELARAAAGVIDGFRFVGCILRGPALVAPMDNMTVTGCQLPDPMGWVEVPVGSRVGGAIPMGATVVEGCQFAHDVALIGAREVLDRFRVSAMGIE